MILKKVFSKTQNLLNSVVVDKSLNKEIYQKSYVRGSLQNSRTIQILDNNSLFSNLAVQNIIRIRGKSFAKQLEGISLDTNSFLYKNKLNSNLKFKSFIFNSLRYKNLLNSFYTSLKILEFSEKRVCNTLLILKPIKGGFTCYSSGVSGFLPRSHGVFLLTKALISALTDKKIGRRVVNLNYLIHEEKMNKIPLLLRLEFALGKIAIYPEFKQNNFSLTSTKKKRDFLNDYNFIFLSQKFYESKTFKKSNFLLNAKVKKIIKK
jgi:hypothetical protein